MLVRNGEANCNDTTHGEAAPIQPPPEVRREAELNNFRESLGNEIANGALTRELEGEHKEDQKNADQKIDTDIRKLNDQQLRKAMQDIREQLSDSITLETLQYPVVALPAGTVHEFTAILTEIKRSGQNPDTRQPLSEDKLVRDRKLESILAIMREQKLAPPRAALPPILAKQYQNLNFRISAEPLPPPPSPSTNWDKPILALIALAFYCRSKRLQKEKEEVEKNAKTRCVM